MKPYSGMMQPRSDSNYISHKGSKGMKWGYNNGDANGKRTAIDNEYQKESDYNSQTNQIFTRETNSHTVSEVEARLNAASYRYRQEQKAKNQAERDEFMAHVNAGIKTISSTASNIIKSGENFVSGLFSKLFHK